MCVYSIIVNLSEIFFDFFFIFLKIPHLIILTYHCLGNIESLKKITNRTDLLFWIFLRSHKGIVCKATVTVGLWGDVLWEWRSPLGEALQARFSLWRHEAWWTHPAHPKDYAHESTANSFWEGSAREWGGGWSVWMMETIFKYWNWRFKKYANFNNDILTCEKRICYNIYWHHFMITCSTTDQKKCIRYSAFF